MSVNTAYHEICANWLNNPADADWLVKQISIAEEEHALDASQVQQLKGLIETRFRLKISRKKLGQGEVGTPEWLLKWAERVKETVYYHNGSDTAEKVVEKLEQMLEEYEVEKLEEVKQ